MRERVNMAIYAGTVAYVLTIAAAVIVRDWRAERARVAGVVTATRAQLRAKYGKDADGLADKLREQEGISVDG